MTLESNTIFALAIFAAALYWLRKKSHPPLPPGPRCLPLVGNLMDVPRSQPWEGFWKLGERYGGIVHLRVPGQSIIVINNAQYATDILDKKSRLYSNRPTFVMAGELVGWGPSPALSNPSSPTWNEKRRLLTQFMGTRTKADSFNHVIQEETFQLLVNLRDSPNDWFMHTRSFSAAIVLLIAYGYKSKGQNDKLVKLVDEAIDQFSEVVASGAFLVDTFPILRYIPSWIPGAGFKTKAQRYRQTVQEMLDRPYDYVRQQMSAGTARPSFISTSLDEHEGPITVAEEHILKWVAAAIYSGGADTTVAGIECFYHAMVSYQNIQAKARAEIQYVLGKGVMPTLADRSRLPYVEGVFLEVLRSYPFAPLGIPHCAAEDDVHEGYFIPKGSIIVTNVWRFFRDSDIYENPEIFSPERFIGEKMQKDPREYLFGFGRRKCPGNYLADASMWLACVSVLATFEIQPPVENGVPVFPSRRHLDGAISHPEPFKVVFVPIADVMRGVPSPITPLVSPLSPLASASRSQSYWNSSRS